MLNALKSLFSTPRPAFKTLDLEAKLTPAFGGGGDGEVEYAAYDTGGSALDIEIYGLEAGEADIAIGSHFSRTLPATAGRVRVHFATRVGHDVPVCAPGERVEVRQHGAVVLSGVFAHD